MKRAIYAIFVISILIIIYTFSSQSSSDSNKLSKSIINGSIEIYKVVSHKEVNNMTVINKYNVYLRKIAHFTEFFLLAIFIFLLLDTTNINKKTIICILVCFAFACLDEVHQYYNGSRDPRMLDVIIDTCGSITSLIVLQKFKIIEKKHIN